VHRAIEAHLLDSSASVREAAVDLIGKYLVDSPDVAGEYYRKIAERIAVGPSARLRRLQLTGVQDTGLGVRKRVIKLLRAFYDVTADRERRIDICSRIVLRMTDEDDGVKDLAVKAVEELWFDPAPPDAARLAAKVSVIMGVCANFRDRQAALEDVLGRVMLDKEREAGVLRARYTEICEALIECLVDHAEIPGFVRGFSLVAGTRLTGCARPSSTACGQSTCSSRRIRRSCRARTR
jgi:cohesin loading factor subunit SCC2